jgi:hypothetical protein
MCRTDLPAVSLIDGVDRGCRSGPAVADRHRNRFESLGAANRDGTGVFGRRSRRRCAVGGVVDRGPASASLIDTLCAVW